MTPPTPRALTVAGIMSGTSADGIDTAIVRITPTRSSTPRIKLIGHTHSSYPAPVRDAIFAAMNAGTTSTAELSRLNWRLGQLYADAVANAVKRFNVKLDLVGLHGQTIYHQANKERYAGKSVRCTWQIGEPAVLRERLNVPIVSDFRPADLAAGGQGAPLVPMLDFGLFRSSTRNRILLNLGGLANVTVIPAGASLEGLIAFDTGPANMVIDELMSEFHGQPFDRNGRVAAKGRIQSETVAQLLQAPYFTAPPPKSCGREQFGEEYGSHLSDLCTQAGATTTDTIATATELTVASILDAYIRFCAPHLREQAPRTRITELIAAGGGTRNAHLMRRLTSEFAAHDVKLVPIATLGLSSEAKEAVAFALLAWLTWHRLPGNIPTATGASHTAILGKLCL